MPDAPTTSAEHVARYFVHLASQGEEQTPITHLQLQKLLYYAQGWHLAVYGSDLFSDRLEAWEHGPVVPTVYPMFADFRSDPIRPSEGLSDVPLADRTRSFIEWIWSKYGGFTGWRLREMTHRESPWLDARKNVAPGASSNAKISSEALRQFFERLHDEGCRKLGIDPVALRDSRDRARKGDVLDWSSFSKELNS